MKRRVRFGARSLGRVTGSALLLFALGCRKSEPATAVLINAKDEGAALFSSAAATESECQGIVIYMKDESRDGPIKDLPSSYLKIIQPAPYSEPDKYEVYLWLKRGSESQFIHLSETSMTRLTRKVCIALRGRGARLAK